MIQIRPVSDLRNKFPEIEKIVEGGEPVYLTKNGYGVMVVLSLEEYTQLTKRIEWRNAFEKLIRCAQGQLEMNPDAECVVVVRTAKNYLGFFDAKKIGDVEAEEEFIQELIKANDTRVKYIVCMSKGNSLSPTSYNLNKRLLEICPENAEAIEILQGEYDSAFRTIQSMMP